MYSKYGSLSSIMLQKKGICRSISYENPKGEKGKAAWTASVLGPSRKGTPFLLNLQPGETFTLADIEGPGVIRQFFITVTDQKEAGSGVLQKLILRMYWERETEPSAECPLGEFFCCGHNEITMLDTEPVAVVPARSFHWYFPMAFSEHARITLENTYGAAISVVAYQVTYTVEAEQTISHFHAEYVRTLWKTKQENDTLIPLASIPAAEEDTPGTYVGSYLSARSAGKKCGDDFLLRLEAGDGSVWYEPVDSDRLAAGGWHSFRIHNPLQFAGELSVSLMPWNGLLSGSDSECNDADAAGKEVEFSGAVYWYTT